VFQFRGILSKQLFSPRRTNYVSTRLTREGFQFVFLLLFVVVAAILQSINMLVLMAGAFSAMLLIQWRLCSRTISEISAQRLLPVKLQARKPFSVQIALTNPRRRLGSWLLMVHDRLMPEDTPQGVGISGFGITMLLDRLLPQSTGSVVYQCTVPARGRYRFSNPELSTRFPLSLMRGYRPLPNSQVAIVQPTPGLLAQNWRDLLKLPVHGQLRRQSASAGGDGEFFGLRGYRLGDPARHIHWRTSAKRGELVIRQFEREENRAVGIVLDLCTLELDKAIEQSGFELAVELVATLIERVVSMDGSIATLAIAGDTRTGNTRTGDRENWVARIQTTNQLNAALDRLALIHPIQRDSLSKSLQQTLRYTGGRDPIIVVSARAKDVFLKKAVFPKRGSTLGQDVSDNLAAESSPNLAALETRIVWVDVTQDQLESIFVRG
jgi:uncharacterized protein (DUF58 family)